VSSLAIRKSCLPANCNNSASLCAARLDTTTPKRFSRDLFLAAADIDPANIGQMYLKSTAKQRAKKPYFVDKLPVNYLNLPLILAALPNAKIVHLVRGPNGRLLC